MIMSSAICHRPNSRSGRQRDKNETMMRALIWIIGATGILALASGVPAAAQGMMQHVDLASPEMASAEMTRADVEAVIASATSRQPAVFPGRAMQSIDLRGN